MFQKKHRLALLVKQKQMTKNKLTENMKSLFET